MQLSTTYTDAKRMQMTVWKQLTKDQNDSCVVVSCQVFTPFKRLLISSALVVFSHVHCLWINGVVHSLAFKALIGA